ncbi:MAG TPA: ATP-binding protein, partial [Tepidisphaeraceae bacterium]|nr:ATP-binding protein [Tepidisphaeraceae bacterium]
MSLRTDLYERELTSAQDAIRARRWDIAARHLYEAAQLKLDQSKEAASEALRKSRLDQARDLMARAKECEEAAAENRPPARYARSPQAESGNRDDTDGGDASDWVVKEKPDIRFDDVAGLDDVKTDIRLKMLYPFQRPDLAEKFGIRAGGGVLMYGPPGTGKTMLAKATAGELEATFFRISPADIMSKWVGEAEQNIKKLFDAAVAEPRSIIFIDEIEALVPARRDEGSSVMQRVVPQLLQGMEGFDKKKQQAILFMGATNVPWQLDPAVLRPGRFDEKVYIPPPDLAARRKLLEIHLGKRPVADDVDLDALATRLDGYSGADIKYICDRAATIPFLQAVANGHEGPITLAIMMEVIGETKRSITRDMLDRFEQWAKQE